MKYCRQTFYYIFGIIVLFKPSTTANSLKAKNSYFAKSSYFSVRVLQVDAALLITVVGSCATFTLDRMSQLRAIGLLGVEYANVT